MLKEAELGSEADEDLYKISLGFQIWLWEGNGSRPAPEQKKVVKAVPGQDCTDESKQGIYLFQKRMELEEFPLQLCTKITVPWK